MLNARNFLKSYPVTTAISLALAAGCQGIPKIERCLVGDAGLVCHDERKPKAQQDYIRSFPESLNYIATNPDDYFTLEEYCKRKKKAAAIPSESSSRTQ